MSKKIPLYILLSLQFAIQVIGIVGIVGYLSYRSGREAVDNLVAQLVDDTGDRIEQELDNYLQQAHQINQLNISALKSGVINLDNLDQLHRYLILQHQQLPNITTLLLGTEKGDFRTIHRVNEEEIKKGITMIQPTDLPLEAGISEITPSENNFNLYTVDKNGNLDRYLETIHNTDVRKRPWYLEAVKSNRKGWSKPFQIGNTNILAINAYAPFYNSDQKIEGIFSANISLNQLSQFLKKISANQNGEIFIIERNGLLIADSYHDTPFYYQIDDIPQPPRQEDFKIKFERISAFDDDHDDDHHDILSTLAEKLKANKSNLDHIQHQELFDVKFENENYYSAVIPYQDSYGLDWLIAVAIPESQFLDTIRYNAYRTFILSIIALIVAIITSIITSRKITRSLSNLSDIANDFNPKSEPPSLSQSYIREISTLSNSFHRMMLNLSEAEKFKRDYTKKLEQEVREKTEILLQAQKIAHTGNWEYNLITQEVMWSEEIYNIYEAIDIMPVPRPDKSIIKIHPDDMEIYQQSILKALEKGEDFDLDLKIITTKNNIRYIQTKGKPIFNQEGKIIKYVGVVIDVTARKEIETELYLKNQELMRATRLKDEFLANMSHELRTPLNAILGNSEILTEQIFGTLNARQLKAIATVESSASHLLALINDILDIAKIEAGETTLERHPTDLKNLCQSVLTFVQQQAYKKNIQLLTDFPPELPYLLIDERRIRQALINLLNNAVKFTPEGGKITLQVSISEERSSNSGVRSQELVKDKDIAPLIRESPLNPFLISESPVNSSLISESPLNPPLIRGENKDNKEFIRIAVIDTGIGISSENLNKLFKPFIQIDSALNRKYTGTGLGLSLVKQIVQLHGGSVGVSSELGKGSCFYFELPFDTYCNIPESSTKEQEKPQTKNITITPSMILLVDDEESNIITIADYLEAKGYQLLIAKNGLQALEITKSQHPNLIIMDIQMPEMDGLDAIALIRQEKEIKDIPIIAATALTMEGDKQRCLDVGANDYISKPMRLKELVEKIETLLDISKN